MNNIVRSRFPRLPLLFLLTLVALNACVTPAPSAPDSRQILLKASAKGGITKTSQEEIHSPRTHLGGEYRDVQTVDAVSFHPYQTVDSVSFSYQSMVYARGLLRYDENTLELIPNMAESYGISQDGLTYIFKLRQGMQWSDGQPLTAQDFKWTWDQAMKPENEFPYLADYEFVASFEAPDDYTLIVKTKQILASGLDAISGWTPLPKHIWEKLDWKNPGKNPEINQPSVFSGPYKLVEWQPDQHAIFEANDKYWYHGAPNISRYVIEIVPDQNAAFEKLKSGEVDTAEIELEKLEEARTLDNITLYEWWPAQTSWEYIGLNAREGFPTHDVHVRRGLAYAIDKDLLAEQALLGMGKRQCSIYPATAWVFNPDVPCYSYNTDQALAEFKQASYTFDGAKMVNAQGEQFTLKLLYGPNTSSIRKLIAVTTQDYLSKIGIKVEIQAMEWSAYLDALASEKPDWDMDIFGWDASIEPAFMCTLFDAKNIPNLNEVAYTNADVDKLCAEANATFDQNVRKEKYQVVQRQLAEAVPYIFLYYGKAWSGQSKRVKGIEPKLLGIGWNRDDWYLEK